MTDIMEQHESDTKVEEEEGLSADAALAFEAIELVVRELDGKVSVDTMADALLTVGFDMVRHIAEHTMPAASNDEQVDAVREHLHSLIDGLSETVWKQPSNQKSE